MKTLFIDTSTVNLIVGFSDNEKNVYLDIQIGKNNHSDHLLNSIKKGLSENNLSVKDFDRIIVGIGPGAYTGLRVSLTVAKMFSWTLNIPMYTISSLDVFVTGLNTDGIYLIHTKAKKDHVYAKVISYINNEYKTLREEEFMEYSKFLEISKEYDYKEILDEEKYYFNHININEKLLTKVTDVTFIEPNYLRGEM
ncbi:MAG: tRNA (adenosine(37)-N6)-threonylcarbamoyltransferase complex dimerization subunit type 1 TsaB [Bacilli bacterium]|jgi:tRNA threonylcarbamoyladenosine biosynthesis protein TsaB